MVTSKSSYSRVFGFQRQEDKVFMILLNLSLFHFAFFWAEKSEYDCRILWKNNFAVQFPDKSYIDLENVVFVARILLRLPVHQIAVTFVKNVFKKLL